MMTSFEIRDKVMEGGRLAIERLIEQKRRDNGFLVFSDDDGKVIILKANELKL